MKTLPLRADKLDVRALADSGDTLRANVPWQRLDRLAAACLGGPQDGAIPLEAKATRRRRVGGEPQLCLELRARVDVALQCQRCLHEMRWPLEVNNRFLFVADESEADALDDGNDEEDVLVLTRHLDLFELLEDELILALPIVPMHDQCDPPAPLRGEEETLELSPAPNAFAALAALKRPSR